jgi:hypothetical protein
VAIGTEVVVVVDVVVVVTADERGGIVVVEVVAVVTADEGAGAVVVGGAVMFTTRAGAVVEGATVVVVGRNMSAIRAVGELSSVIAPLEFVAVTSNLMYMSMSSSVSVYERDVALEMFVYEPEDVAARFHRYVYVGVG